MKFKYNFYEKKLWRIEEEYSYEIGEENRQVEIILFIGYKIQFKLGQNHYLFLSSDDELSLKMTVHYLKPLKNGELLHYEKKITRSWFGIETIFELSEEDRVEKNEKGHWIPKQTQSYD